MLKVNQLEQKQPKHQNGTLQKQEPKENSSKSLSKNTVLPRPTDGGKKVKVKSVPASVSPKVSQINLKVSEARQSAAPKRKKDSGKSNSKQAAKKSSVVEDRKPTE